MSATDTQRPSSKREFEHGLAVALSCNAALLVGLYAVAAPTRDIRARVPLLLEALPTLWLTLSAIGAVAGLIGLALTGGWSWRSVAGVTGGGCLAALVVASGIMDRLIPASYDSRPKWWLLGLAIIAAALSLYRQRRRLNYALFERAA